MTDDCSEQGAEQNKAWKKEMLDKHRPAFDLWLCLAQVQEQAVVKERTLDSAFARALDLFFIQAFKSHQSLYPLCVMGHGEDAATIARRLLEIALQVAYLCSEEPKREERGATYLAHFWHNAKEIAAAKGLKGLPQNRCEWWEEQCERHKKLLVFKKSGEPVNFWFGSNFRELAVKLGLQETYDKDYRFLSHAAHCSSRGLLLDRSNDVIQIKSDLLIREVLVFGTRYAIWVTANWNEHSRLMDTKTLEKLRDEAMNFDFNVPCCKPNTDRESHD
jgi:hypothetical protein